MYWKRIAVLPGLGLLQRFDLLAELSSPGPVVRATLGVAGSFLVALFEIADGGILLPLFSLGVLQPIGYTLVSLGRHPEPGATVKALALLPIYAIWRIVAASRDWLTPGSPAWVRTPRHQEEGA